MLDVDMDVEVRGELQCSRACFQGAGLGPQTEDTASGRKSEQEGEEPHRRREASLPEA